ncbi:MAG: carboxymuconolactone decarboxylase family protein, partial [Chloroflexota bacterium]|nr:carboxymuconolactone decarboxylase family protein [Chloroflexota bacterium]
LTVLQRENQLRRHVESAVTLGLTAQQVIEVMIHASFYGGVPTAFTSMGVAQEIFEAKNIPFSPQLVFDPSETPDDLYQRGVKRRQELMGAPTGTPRPGPITQAEREFTRLTTESYWGSVWTRPGLDLQSRSICTQAALTLLGREGPLHSHIKGAVNNGLTQEEIIEVFIQTTFYGGLPFTRAAMDIANEIFLGNNA